MTEGGAFRWIEAFAFALVFHVGVGAGVLWLFGDGRFLAPDDAGDVEVIVTSITFDTASLNAVEDDGPGEPGTEAVSDPETVEPEVQTDDGATEVEPEEEPVQEAAVADPVEPEPSVEPDVPEATPPPPEPEDLSPVLPTDQTLTAVRPVAPEVERLRPNGSDGGVGSDPDGDGTAVAPVEPDRIVAGRLDTALTPESTGRTVIALPQSDALVRDEPLPEEVQTVNALIERIRGQLGEACLIALPQRTGDGEARLTLISPDEQSIAEFSQAVVPGLQPEPLARDILIDRRQCPAVTFIRSQPSYPVGQLSIIVSADRVESGGRLLGSISGAAGRYVSLLLIDDNGVVQDLNRFVTFAGGQARFDVPVTRNGPPRDTGQILLALATARRPLTIETEAGRLAEDVFPPLAEELGQAVAIGIVPFSVR
ncbi:hypothetical protein AAD018_003755 [Aestuariibius insulae]|uniref:hypothetical protein n=1 Tax=Aestuariibius insulae TaxID=2058287 RepID=UPI00345E3EC0